jgi:hypothetical protein
MPHDAIFPAEICLDGAKFSHGDSGLSALRYRIVTPYEKPQEPAVGQRVDSPDTP